LIENAIVIPANILLVPISGTSLMQARL